MSNIVSNIVRSLTLATDVRVLECHMLNERNKLLTEEFVLNLLKKYGIIDYKISNFGIFQRAMTHKSYLKSCVCDKKILKSLNDALGVGTLSVMSMDKYDDVIPLQDESYEVLEFIGDSILHKEVGLYLFKRYPKENEGFLSTLRTKIERGVELEKYARVTGLYEYVLLSRLIEAIGRRDNNGHIFEDVFEAFIGAFYIDSGEDNKIVGKFIINVIEKHFDFSKEIYHEENYKGLLLNHYHSMKKNPPVYETLNINHKKENKDNKDSKEEDNGKSVKKYYRVCVKNDHGMIIGEGVSSSKKTAEQEAAYNVLLYYGVIDGNKAEYYDYGDDDEEII